jgi:hypothetical protein
VLSWYGWSSYCLTPVDRTFIVAAATLFSICYVWGMLRSFLLSGVMSAVLSVTALCQNLVINEMMASSSGVHLVDEDGDASDWIEIYNPTGTDIDLGQHYLSDKVNDMLLWGFPDTVIAAGGFMVVFASNKDRATAGSELHTNFAISAGGEQLFLTHLGDVIHTVPAVALATDVSYGFISDGSGPMAVFTAPTPGASNALGELQFQLEFSATGGVYATPFDLSITTDVEGLVVRYTTDGSAPTATSTIAAATIALSNGLVSTADISQVQITPISQHLPPDPSSVPKVIVITAAAFTAQGQRVSEPVTHTYVVGELGMGHGNLPIVSIAIERNGLFDPDTGIFVPGVHWEASNPEWTGNYYQTGSGWEREMHVEMLESNGTVGFRQRAGLRTHGGNSRRFPQKGMRLYARSEYGQSRFNHAVFPEKSIDSFKRFILRPFMSSWSQNGIDDILSNRLAVGLETDFMGSRTVAVYINGEFWGIYTMQERPDERYLEDNHGIDRDDVDIISAWWGEESHGDNTAWFDLYNSMEAANLSDSDQYAAMTDRIDIANFIDYQLLQIFIANYDWPANNMRCWFDRTPGGQWRWIFFDGDAGLQTCDFQGFEHATSTSDQGWPTNAQSTLFLRRFLENPDFLDLFIERAEMLLNTRFAAAQSTPLFDEIRADIEDEVPLQLARFGFPESMELWNARMESCHDFLHCRPCGMVEQMEAFFGVTVHVPQCLIGISTASTTLSSLHLSPNPNEGVFRVDNVDSFSENVDVTIHDMTGRSLPTTVWKEDVQTLKVDASALPAGFYVVRIGGGSGSQALRFIKQ